MNTSTFERLAAALGRSYRIERELGQGGMATVYLAEDLKHRRQVAIKVLKPELAAVIGAERFLQEITTTAALQHPHILPLFDSGEADGFLFYVMPFIDGETLRTRLDRETQLGIADAVAIASDVADALHHAHEHGVIHRDIKPENILLSNGRPIVADFGIALAVSAASGARVTETGLSLGTPHYMSPEQATAEKDLTSRSDIYALGSVLYEMLAGTPPHTGATAQQIIMKIVTEAARPVTELRRSVPPNVAAAVDIALEKVAADRFPTAAAFAAALRNPAFTGTGPVIAAGRAARPLRREPVVLGLAAVALVCAVALAAVLGRGNRTPPAAVNRFAVEFADEVRTSQLEGPAFAISDDGAKFAYFGASGVLAQILVRSRDKLTPEPVPSTTDVRCCLSFSPDGESLAYVTMTSAVRTVSLQSGVSRIVVDSGVQDVSLYGGGIDWGPDGWIYVSMTDGIARFPGDGGEGERVSTTQSNQRTHGWIDVLPSGKGALLTVVPEARFDGDSYAVGVVDFATQDVTILVQGGYGRYAASGHLVFFRTDGTLLAAPFDQNRLVLTGDAVPLDTGIAVGSYGAANFALSPSGTMLSRRRRQQRSSLRVVGRDGTVAAERASELPWMYGVRLSPDARRWAASAISGEGEHIVTQDVAGGEVMTLTFEGQRNSRHSWSSSGEEIFFSSDRDNPGALFVTPADGTGSARRITLPEPRPVFDVVSVDDSTLIIRTDDQAAGAGDILLVHLGADTTVTSLVATPAADLTPAVSPDRRWLAYQSEVSGRHEIYVRPLPPATGGTFRVSITGGTEPAWAHSGRELFYRDGNGDLVAVTVSTSPTFRVVSRQVLFSATGFSSNPFSRQYDVFPDDQRFLMVLQEAPEVENQTVMVLNWFEELRARTAGR